MCIPADLTVSKRPGISYQTEIHFAVVNHISFVFLYETCLNLVSDFNEENYKSARNLKSKQIYIS